MTRNNSFCPKGSAFFVSLATAFAFIVMSSPLTAGEFKKTTIRFGSTSAENTVVVATMKDFAKRVAEATNGNVTVRIFPASQLGSAKDMSQSAQMGGLDMCMNQPANLADMGVSDMTVLVLPYIFRSYDHRWNVLMGDFGQEMLDKVSSAGLKLHGFGFFLDGARNFFTVAGKPIRKIEDVKGLKLRVQNYAIDTDMAEALGASPTPTAASEMYASLQSGIVDGAEQPIAAFWGYKFTEVCKFYTLDEHTYNTLPILYSEMKWKNLDDATREVLLMCWRDAMTANKEKVIENEAQLLDQIRAAGVEVIELTDREKWVEAMKPIYATHAKDKMDLVKRIQDTK